MELFKVSMMGSASPTCHYPSLLRVLAVVPRTASNGSLPAFILSASVCAVCRVPPSLLAAKLALHSACPSALASVPPTGLAVSPGSRAVYSVPWTVAGGAVCSASSCSMCVCGNLPMWDTDLSGRGRGSLLLERDRGVDNLP